MRRVARIIAVALITAGLVVLADAGLTLVWKEPLSTAYGSIKQSQAADKLGGVRDSFLELPAVSRLADDAHTRRAARGLADVFATTLEKGKPIGRIHASSIDANYVVVQGTDSASLQKGPGHYPETALPGQGKTIGIAGHRTTYLAPFNRIDDIERGDAIKLKMPYGTFTYEVTDTSIVDPTDVQVVDDVGRERLVLTACHPLYSAAQRYVVFADLESIELVQPG